jgi:hypothetical protein
MFSVPDIDSAPLASEELVEWMRKRRWPDQEFDALRDAAVRITKMYGCSFIQIGSGEIVSRAHRSAVVLSPGGVILAATFLPLPENGQKSIRLSDVSAAAQWVEDAPILDSVNPSMHGKNAWYLSTEWDTAIQAARDQVRLMELLLQRTLSDHEVAAPDLCVVDGGMVRLEQAARDVLVERLAKVHQDGVHVLLSALEKMFDPEVVELLRLTGFRDVRRYNWLSGRIDRAGIDEEVGIRRRQAVTALPLAINLMMDRGSSIGAAIASGASSTKALVDDLRCGKPVAKMLNGLSPEDVGLRKSPDVSGLRAMSGMMMRMPKGNRPSIPSGWQGFFSAVSFVRAIEGVERVDHESRQPLIDRLAGRWDSVSSDVFPAEQAVVLPDMIDDLATNLFWPVSERLGHAFVLDRTKILDLLSMSRDAVQVSRALSWWSGNQGDIRRRISARFPVAGGSAVAWPALFEVEEGTPNGIIPVCLTSESDLDDEHRRMGHCVNTYVSRCLFEGAHIVSFRIPDGGPSVSTIEISQTRLFDILKTNKKRLRTERNWILQHRGERNGAPPPEAIGALEWWIDQVIDESILIDTDGLERDLRLRKSKSTKGGGALFYDHLAQGAVEAIWEAYGPLFVGEVRNLDPVTAISTHCLSPPVAKSGGKKTGGSSLAP